MLLRKSGKALIEHNDLKYIAKFSASNDTYSVVKVEYIAMRLAALCGLTVAPDFRIFFKQTP